MYLSQSTIFLKIFGKNKQYDLNQHWQNDKNQGLLDIAFWGNDLKHNFGMKQFLRWPRQLSTLVMRHVPAISSLTKSVITIKMYLQRI